MHLSAYHFDGDPTRLGRAHDEMTADVPAGGAAACTSACGPPTASWSSTPAPARADAEAFQQSPEFAAALAEAGLPTPRVESARRDLGRPWGSR